LNTDEALARCEYLIDSRAPFGLIAGPPGSGKSELLGHLSAPRHSRTRPVLLDVTGCDAQAIVTGLANALAAGLPECRWRDRIASIRDRLDGCSECGYTQLVLLDHLEAAQPNAIELITHLLRSTRGLTIIGAASTPVPPAVMRLNHDLGWLRIELTCYEERQTGQAARSSLERAGRHPHALTAGCTAELQALTGGRPGQIQRLLDLVLLAAEADQLEGITPELVRSAAAELATTPLA
jgi:type II secretory pathway predicted ATPase ExeA